MRILRKDDFNYSVVYIESNDNYFIYKREKDKWFDVTSSKQKSVNKELSINLESLYIEYTKGDK
jgi:hypothetical protein